MHVMRARVPASSANLGPGFDTLGLALDRYTEVTIEPADELRGILVGEGSQYPLNERHLAVRIVGDILGHTRVHITINSDIPVSRGLGSSAALSVAVAAAAGHSDPLSYAAFLEGHADNAAAAVLGGFVTATIVDGRVYATRLPLDPDLTFVAVVPDRHLATVAARAALPSTVTFGDAVSNLGRMGLLISGMADGSRLVPSAGTDHLHQPFRASLFPESTVILHGLVEAGALTAFWSGAGPTLLGVCQRSNVRQVCDAGEEFLQQLNVPGRVYALNANTTGLELRES